MGPHPAVAAIRLAVRRVLHDLLTEHHTDTDAVRAVPALRAGGPADGTDAPARTRAARPDAMTSGTAGSRPRSGRDTLVSPPVSPPLVLVACSGGADSMALASALAFEAPRLGVRAGGVT